MSRFEPVFLSKPLEAKKISMTALRHYDGCPRSGYFYLEHKDAGAQSVEMVRGSALHAVVERGILAMLQAGEPIIPPELLKAIVNEALAEYPVPTVEHDYIREMAYRWADQTTIDPSQVAAIETLIVLEAAGWQVRCKIDFAELQEGGALIRVDDYKSSKAAPGYEEIARKRPDGTMTAKQFQLIVYGLAAAYGSPVRLEPCSNCAPGTPQDAQRAEGDSGCDVCRDRRFVEIPEPYPIGASAQVFELRLVFPGIKNSEGQMITRPVTLTKMELDEYREGLAATLLRLDKSIETGDWPAIQSKAACGECPARSLCPIPKELRDHAGEINTVEDAAEASEVLEGLTARAGQLRKEIKAFVKGRDMTELRYGRTRAWRFGFSESERIGDKDAMWEAIDRAVQFGEPFEKSDFVKTVQSTPFKVEDVESEEPEIEED